ncbi:hypothetical protein K1719_016888 [Acacia pycnantha]|nr:hypothetical protein K1719_016888 [Acacia pycnantha]
MPSPDPNEASHICPQGCCPSPFFNSPASQRELSRARNSCAACRHSFATATCSSIFPNTQFTNHESLPSLQDSFSEFIKVYPQYSDTEQVDHIRAKEYCHPSAFNHTCLDYIGIGLFSFSQLQRLDVSETQDASPSISKAPQGYYSDFPLFSISPRTGNIKTLLLHGGQVSEFESALRKRIMSFLNVSDSDYFMLFTASRTAAFKLVAQSYPFKASRKLLTVYDHESEAVETMISSSEKRGAKVMSAEFKWPRLRIQSAKLRKMIVRRRRKKKKRGLFVFPIHSRVTGARYPYLWISIAQENGWHVLVDACALGPKEMDSFGLSLFRPDFIICPFYKVFGEDPSGFGCLFVKKSLASILEDSSSAGIVNLIPERQPFQASEDSSGTDIELEKKSSRLQEELSSSSFFSQKQKVGESSGLQRTEVPAESKAPKSSASDEIHSTFESQQERKSKDGEDKYLNIECRCLDQVDSLGLILITNRARYLINWLVSSLLKLKHPNTEGAPLIKIYGPKIKFDRGPALAFNVFDWKGEKVEPVLVQRLADRSNISLGCGFLRHIWFADKFAEEKERVQNTKESGGQGGKKKYRDNMGITVVTAALGFLANFEDMHKLWAFVARFLDADFVEKERWRYTGLNQKTIEI